MQGEAGAASGFHWRLALASLLVALGHAAWIVTFRPGYGIGLDEARLLPVAHRLSTALGEGDLGELARTWADHEVTAPLLALVAAPFLAIVDDPVVAAALPVAAFAGLLVFASAQLALILADRTAAVLTAVATAVGTGFVLWARVHEQIVPAAALWVLSIVLLLRSDGLRRPAWRRGAGVVLGLALVVRTMLVAFVPVLLVLYALHCHRRATPSRLQGWGELIGLCVLVAGSWWGFQWRSAVDYLGPRGYGSSDGGFPLAPERWVLELGFMISVGGLCLLVALPVLVGALRRARRRPAALDLADPRVLVAAVAVVGFVILVTVGEEYPGFQMLIAPLVLALAASVRWPRDRRGYQAAFALAAGVSLVIAVLPGASWLATVDAPAARLVHGPPARHRVVARLPDEVIRTLADRLPPGGAALAAVYDDHHFQNAHLFEAAGRLERSIDLRAMDSSVPAPAAVRDAWPEVALVLVYEVEGCVFEGVDMCELEQRLAEAGFVVSEEWEVLDGRELRMWTAPSP